MAGAESGADSPFVLGAPSQVLGEGKMGLRAIRVARERFGQKRRGAVEVADPAEIAGGADVGAGAGFLLDLRR